MSTVQKSGWVGWVRFAAIILIIDGIISVVQGIAALAAPDYYYVVGPKGLWIFQNVAGAGWWTLILGVLLVLAGLALFSGASWARIVAVIVATVSAVGALVILPAQVWWSLIIIGLDVLVIFAVTVHGRELQD
ncbi:MAG TPA: hypothetical protein VGI56_05425 [Galbitalea sp.]|jgi:hypothetical protein